MKSQKGFSIALILMIMAIVALIGSVGYFVYSNNKPKTDQKSTTTNSSKQTQAAPAGTTQSIDELTANDVAGESAIDAQYSETESTTAQSANSAAANVGGSLDESSL